MSILVFLAEKEKERDPNVIIDTGILYFNHATNTFMIGSEDKLLGSSRTGNIMQIDESKKSIYTEGKFDFEFNFMKGFKLETAGNATLDIEDSTFRFNMAFGLDFDLPKSVQEKIFAVATAAGNGKTTSVNTDFVKSAIAELVPEGDINKLVKRIESSGNISPSTIVSQTKSKDITSSQFLISESQWYFDHRHRSLISNGEITIAALGGKNVNRSYKCVMGLEKRRSGDRLNIYLEFNEYEWIYMNYVRGILYIYSSDNDVNQLIVNEGGKVSKGGV